MEALIAKTTPRAERAPIAEPVQGCSLVFYLSLVVLLQLTYWCRRCLGRFPLVKPLVKPQEELVECV